jgi:hypothetical protein
MLLGYKVNKNLHELMMVGVGAVSVEGMISILK